MLSKGLKSGTHSFLADVGRIILWLAWICFLAWLVKSCIDLATRNHAWKDDNLWLKNCLECDCLYDYDEMYSQCVDKADYFDVLKMAESEKPE